MSNTHAADPSLDVNNHEAMASRLQTEQGALDIELMTMRQRIRDMARQNADFCRDGANHLYAAVDALISAWDYLDTAYINAINEQLHAERAENGPVHTTSFGDC